MKSQISSPGSRSMNGSQESSVRQVGSRSFNCVLRDNETQAVSQTLSALQEWNPKKQLHSSSPLAFLSSFCQKSRFESYKNTTECCHFIPCCLYVWHHKPGQCVWQKHRIGHEPTFHLLSTSKVKQTNMAMWSLDLKLESRTRSPYLAGHMGMLGEKGPFLIN